MRTAIITFTFVLTLLLGVSLQAQNLSVADGDWVTDATWNSGTSPGFTTLGNTIVDSYVISNSGLDFSGNHTYLNVDDTLIVYGDVVFDATSGAAVNVGANNVLIIFGNLDMGKNHAGVDIGAGGLVVVTGNITSTGTGGDFTGAGTVYTDGTTEGMAGGNTGGEHPIDQIEETEGGKLTIEEFVTGGGTTPLPVEFLFFNGKYEGAVALTWATASEKDNDRFEIERSEDGSYFYTIDKVEGFGTTNEQVDYSYKDHSSIGSISYYRLKQVDYDGVYDYSETIRVETGNEAGNNSFNLYPTSVKSAPISINANRAFEVRELTIFGLSGASQERNVTFERVHPSEIEVITSTLQNGIYLLRLTTSEGEVVNRKFVVQ